MKGSLGTGVHEVATGGINLRSSVVVTCRAQAKKQAIRWCKQSGGDEVQIATIARFKRWPKRCAVTDQPLDYDDPSGTFRPVLLRTNVKAPWTYDNMRIVTMYVFKRGLHNPDIAPIVLALQEANKAPRNITPDFKTYHPNRATWRLSRVP